MDRRAFLRASAAIGFSSMIGTPSLSSTFREPVKATGLALTQDEAVSFAKTVSGYRLPTSSDIDFVRDAWSDNASLQESHSTSITTHDPIFAGQNVDPTSRYASIRLGATDQPSMAGLSHVMQLNASASDQDYGTPFGVAQANALKKMPVFLILDENVPSV